MKFWRVIDIIVALSSLGIGIAIIFWSYQPPNIWPVYILLGIVLLNKATQESNY